MDRKDESRHKEAFMKKHTFRGSPAEVGGAQGSMSPEAARDYLKFWQARPHDFENP
jgi:hypothetical protein